MIFWLWILPPVFPLISDWITISNLGVPCPCLPLGSVPTCICCLLFNNATFPLSFPYVGAKAPERAHRKLNAKQCPGHLWKSRVFSFSGGFHIFFIPTVLRCPNKVPLYRVSTPEMQIPWHADVVLIAFVVMVTFLPPPSPEPLLAMWWVSWTISRVSNHFSPVFHSYS